MLLSDQGSVTQMSHQIDNPQTLLKSEASEVSDESDSQFEDSYSNDDKYTITSYGEIPIARYCFVPSICPGRSVSPNIPTANNDKSQKIDVLGRDLRGSDYQIKSTNPQRSINSPATGRINLVSPQIQELERHSDLHSLTDSVSSLQGSKENVTPTTPLSSSGLIPRPKPKPNWRSFGGNTRLIKRSPILHGTF